MPNSFLIKYRKEIILFFTALFAQLVVFLLTRSYGSDGFLWSSDAEGYFALVKNFIKYHGFYLDYAFGPQALRTPVYPLFAALLYWLVPKLEFVILIQNILAAAVIVIIYRFGKKFLGEWTGFIGAFLFIFESQRLQVANQLMTETLFFAFFIPGLHYWLDSTSKKPMYRASLLAGIFFGLATLTRPTPYPMIFILPLVTLVFGFIRKNVKKYFFCAAIFFFSSFIIILPWLIRQKVLFGRFTIASGLASYVYNINAMRFLEYKGVPEPQKFVTEKAIRELGYVGRSPATTVEDWKDNGIFELKYLDYLYNEGVKIISQDPLFFARIYVQKMIVFYLDSSASRSYHAILYGLHLPDVIFYPIMYWGGRLVWGITWLVIIVGVIVNRKSINFWFYALALWLAVFFAVSLAMNSDPPRLRLAVTPLILLMFADQLLKLTKKFHAK